MIPEVKKTVSVNASPMDAFDVFTKDVASWWPFENHSISHATGSTTKNLVITPDNGGAITEYAEDGREFIWGNIKIWQPGERLTFSWLMGVDEETSSEIDITFEAMGQGCRVTLIHRNWDGYAPAAQEKRDHYDKGWVKVFEECYAGACK